MRVLVACEYSGIVRDAFSRKGHDAWSCDLLPTESELTKKEGKHIEGDVGELLDEYFDLVIFHPPCDYIANSGVRWLYEKENRWDDMKDGCDFFNLRHKFNSLRVATENPIPHKHAVKYIGKYDQIFQPWHFGHKQMKATCLWLKNLPPLKYTDVVGPPPKDKKERYKWQDTWTLPPGPERGKLRSRTFAGVAKSMANQWG